MPALPISVSGNSILLNAQTKSRGAIPDSSVSHFMINLLVNLWALPSKYTENLILTAFLPSPLQATITVTWVPVTTS